MFLSDYVHLKWAVLTEPAVPGQSDLAGYNTTDLAWHHACGPEMRINSLCQSIP